MTANLAQHHRDVVFGQSGGRIIWQPRIECWYTDKLAAGEPLPPPFTGMTQPEIHRALGCSARPYGAYSRCFKRVEHPDVKVRRRTFNETDTETVFATPAGAAVEVSRAVPGNPYPIHLKWQVSTEAELRVAAWREEHTSWRWDAEAFEEAERVWGDLSAPTACLPRVNIQSLYINEMGVENAVYAIYDWPDAVAAYVRASDACHERLIDVVNASPVEIINFGDNVHAGTLSPELFDRYVLPAYQRRCERLHAAGKFVHAHWDGDTKPLLRYARATGLDGIEAITPKPQGDVTLEEIKEALGDEMFLIDGLPAVFFDETYPVSVLEDCTRRLIELFAPRLVLGISDEISSTGDIERVRRVGEIVDEYNAGCGSS